MIAIYNIVYIIVLTIIIILILILAVSIAKDKAVLSRKTEIVLFAIESLLCILGLKLYPYADNISYLPFDSKICVITFGVCSIVLFLYDIIELIIDKIKKQ